MLHGKLWRPNVTVGRSGNLGLRNEIFRNYADYMLTKTFRDAIKRTKESERITTGAVSGSDPIVSLAVEAMKAHRAQMAKEGFADVD